MKAIVASLLGAVFVGAGSASAAELALSPASGAVFNGASFDVAVLIDSTEPVMAAEATLSFDPNAFVVERIDTDGSILVTWPTQPLFSNERGVIQFSGSADAPFTGSDGRIMTVRFRVLANGSHAVRFDDGVALSVSGSNIVSALVSGVYRAEPETRAPEASIEPIAALPPDQPEPPVPILERGDTGLATGDRLVVKGLVVPDVLVRITIETNSGETSTHSVPAAGDGSFIFVSDFRVSEGVYRVRAASEGGGKVSEMSETVTFTVRPLGLAAAAGTAVDVLSLTLPFLGLIALIGFSIALVVSRRRRTELTGHL